VLKRQTRRSALLSGYRQSPGRARAEALEDSADVVYDSTWALSLSGANRISERLLQPQVAEPGRGLYLPSRVVFE
jgi:hypothetical protein